MHPTVQRLSVEFEKLLAAGDGHRQRQAAVIRQEAEQRFNPVGIRERLLARRSQHG